MKVEVIDIWNGTNFIQIIKILATKNTEIRIKIKGKKLIVKDPLVDYYSCVALGCPVEIPVHDHPIVEEDEPIPYVEPPPPQQRQYISEEEEIRLLKEWGLYDDQTCCAASAQS